MPLFLPVSLSVSASISFRTSLKSVNFLPFAWRNSAHSTTQNKGWRLSGGGLMYTQLVVEEGREECDLAHESICTVVIT